MTSDPYVLIVDDEEPVRDVIGRMLARSGLRLRYATNADDALTEVYAHPPMVVVADVHMPGRSGLWLASQVQDISPRTAIVLASGDGELPSSETLRTGVVAYVLKPFRPQAIVAAVADGVRWWQDAHGSLGGRSALSPHQSLGGDVQPTGAHCEKR